MKGLELYDKTSLKRIKTAHPKLRDELVKIYHDANRGLGKARLRKVRLVKSKVKVYPCINNSKGTRLLIRNRNN